MGTMTDEYRRKLIEGIRLVTDACYMQKEQDACTYMCELIPGLSSLAETFPETGVETIIGEALKAIIGLDLLRPFQVGQCVLLKRLSQLWLFLLRYLLLLVC